jgi:LuxR family transcriptional regulator, maltose regulon positive regulatory protein
MSELATPPVVPRELRPPRFRRDRSGNVAVGPWPIKGARLSAGEPGTPDVPAAPPISGGVVSRCALFERLANAERVVQISAPAGSGKTVLMRSWIAEAGLARHAAWVSVDSEERDPQRFWMSVLGALRETAPGAALVRALTVAPDVDGWAIAERLLTDLAPLADRIWLVIDDVHELGPDALRPLELLVSRAPPDLRLVLATRHDLRLGLHRLRLEGELTEIREHDLRFTVAEARELFAAAGVQLPEAALVSLHERTEGWAAGLRLAALSLAGHPDPERFAAEFSGTEHTVAEYLLAEVLDRQPEEVRRLLLRTSILERVNGELADLLTGDLGGERVLQDLEKVNAFVISLDGPRSWFRYHQMFAGLLQLELRRTAPTERAALHGAAARWLAEHGHPVEAVRQAQAGADWALAARLLMDGWLDLYLSGRGATLVELLARFPGWAVAASPELTTVRVACDLIDGSLEDAGAHLAEATGALASVPANRRGRVQVMLAVLRLFLARRRVDIPVVVEEARRLLALTASAGAGLAGLGEDLRAAALISLGIAETWALRFDASERHLEQGITLARQIGRPYLEFNGLAHGTHAMLSWPHALRAERSWQVIALTQRHGWDEEPLAGVAYTQLGIVLLYQGRLDEAEPWLERAERTLRTRAEPAAGMSLRHARAALELARGRYQEALAAFDTAEQLRSQLAGSNALASQVTGWMLATQARVGRPGEARARLAALDHERASAGEIRNACAVICLAERDPAAALDALEDVLDGTAPVIGDVTVVEAQLLAGLAHRQLGDQRAANQAAERALALAEADRLVLPFAMTGSAELLEALPRHETAHAALLADVLDILHGSCPAAEEQSSSQPTEELSPSELRVLRYLPTNLSRPEIAGELSLSVNTVNTHARNIYAKLQVRDRSSAVQRAREMRLLAVSVTR